MQLPIRPCSQLLRIVASYSLLHSIQESALLHVGFHVARVLLQGIYGIALSRRPPCWNAVCHTGGRGVALCLPPVAQTMLRTTVKDGMDTRTGIARYAVGYGSMGIAHYLNSQLT